MKHASVKRASIGDLRTFKRASGCGLTLRTRAPGSVPCILHILNTPLLLIAIMHSD